MGVGAVLRLMNWFNKIFKTNSRNPTCPEDLIRFYQELGFFDGADPVSIVRQYTEEHGAPPNTSELWNDVYLLAYSIADVWADDPEADVCVENEVYSEILPKWASISHNAFAPTGLSERWDSESGPITLSFDFEGRRTSLSPTYQDDWIDLSVLLQINSIIAPSGRQFECAVDGNFALVLCLTPEQKKIMQTQRQFPFAW